VSKVTGYLLIFAGLGLAGSLLPITTETQPGGMIDDRVHPDWPVQITASAKMPGLETGPRIAAVTQPPPKPNSPEAPVIVTIRQHANPAPATHPKAAPIPTDRATLARELQHELRRVGCYDGALNGVWTTSTRNAMKALRIASMLCCHLRSPTPFF
jgi:hypothetical protein